ncbi:Holliday junction branch migration protein RuvA [Candidatus Hepatincolaceae symbiont of Richtersius coronifer]
MFAKLTGIIDLIEEDTIILEVNGVGYLISIPLSLMANLELGVEQAFYIQTIVNEDSIALYGFKEIQQKRLFNLLITVQGIGPKIALIIIARIALEELQKAILFENVILLKTIQGIGLKGAQRLINELKDKITKINLPNFNISSTLVDNKSFSNIKDATLALQNLGYSNFEINKAMLQLKATITSETSTEKIIKEALTFFVKTLN